MRRCRPLLGTFVEIDGADAVVIEAGFAAVERVQRLMSAHDPDSELSRLNRSGGGSVPLLPETLFVLRRAQFWARRSDGRFDVVVAGHHSLRRGAIPLHPGQPVPNAARGYRSLRLEGQRGWLIGDACIDLGGIAKGFAVDAAVEAMRAAGATDGLVNAGGDLFAFGEPREVQLVDPRTRRPRLAIAVRDCAVATSAGLPRGDQELDFGHLGGAANQLSVTVVASSALDADALTKIAWRGHPRLTDLLALADARLIAFDGEEISILPNDLAVAA